MDLAVGQCLPEFGDASIGCLGPPNSEHLQVGHPFEVYQPRVGDLGLAKGELLQVCQPLEIDQPCFKDLLVHEEAEPGNFPLLVLFDQRGTDCHDMCFRRIDLQHLLGFYPVRASPDPGADQNWPGGGEIPWSRWWTIKSPCPKSQGCAGQKAVRRQDPENR